jgi:hypothetical protein
MGPFLVVFMGFSLVTIPEAGRVLRRSPRHLRPFCLLIGGGLAIIGFAWGFVLLLALPRGLGAWLLGPIWRPAYPLILALTISVAGACLSAGAAGTGRADPARGETVGGTAVTPRPARPPQDWEITVPPDKATSPGATIGVCRNREAS